MKGPALSAPWPRGYEAGIGLQGCAWQSPEGIAAPDIWHDRARLFEDVVSAWVGETYIARQPGEVYFSGADDSFVQRTARTLGTDTPWRLQYRDRAADA